MAKKHAHYASARESSNPVASSRSKLLNGSSDLMTNSDSNACCHTFALVASIFGAIVCFAIFSADIHGPMLISCFPDTFGSLHHIQTHQALGRCWFHLGPQL